MVKEKVSYHQFTNIVKNIGIVNSEVKAKKDLLLQHLIQLSQDGPCKKRHIFYPEQVVIKSPLQRILEGIISGINPSDREDLGLLLPVNKRQDIMLPAINTVKSGVSGLFTIPPL